MARKFPTLKKPDPSKFKGWTFVLIFGGGLALLAMLDRGALNAASFTDPVPGGRCQFEVTIDNLNVRSAPTLDGNAPVQTVSRGQRVQATPTVQNGYRELEGRLWVLDQHLVPVAGSPCN